MKIYGFPAHEDPALGRGLDPSEPPVTFGALKLSRRLLDRAPWHENAELAQTIDEAITQKDQRGFTCKCPNCGGDEVSVTLLGFLGPDRNSASCPCGWAGEAWQCYPKREKGTRR